MILHTASEIISFTRLLENETAEFYERLCRFDQHCEALCSFARENRRNVVQVQQAYNNIISDALEGGFAFDIEAGDFQLTLPVDDSFPEAVRGAAQIEITIARLYTIAAAQSQSLLGDVSRAMKTVAGKHQARAGKLLEITVS